MNPPLRERFRWSANADPDMAIDAAVMARVFGYFFLLGGILGLATTALPHPGDVHEAGVIVPSLLALAGALVFFVAFDRLPLWYFHAMLALAVVFVAVAIVSGGGVVGVAFSTMYFWSAITAFSLFSARAAVFHMIFLGAVYAVALTLRSGLMVAPVQWLMVMGSILVAGLSVAMLRRRLEMLLARVGHDARTDALTGLVNRRGFEERFDVELERAQRNGRALAVIAVDLDHFKQVNDRFGHQAGDEALELLGAALLRTTRRVDLVARVGGEEFMIVAPDTAPALGYALAERVRAEVARTFADGTFGTLTASCGVSCYPGDGSQPAQLVHAADEALYAAKEAGRNRTAMYSPELAAAVTPVDRDVPPVPDSAFA